jgi:redox-sensitive bicupin YhaK (pirin superfamily)
MSMIANIIEQRRKDLGGFEVGRVLPSSARRMVGPFVFFDHVGPADFAPHPHIGLSTITYLFEGEIMHRDSVGSVQPIRAGEVNWMTAGRGITHSERFEKARLVGDRLHGIQTWVALPDSHEEMAPEFSHHGMGDLPSYEDRGIFGRLIAGRAFGATAKVPTLSPMFYTHWNLQAGAVAALPAEYPERAAYVATGEVEVEGQVVGAGRMMVFAPGETIALKAVQPSTIMLIGGDPVGERFLEWNFVSSSRERIAQAKADWRAGRMKLPDADHDEFIPLPEQGPGRSEPNAFS